MNREGQTIAGALAWAYEELAHQGEGNRLDAEVLLASLLAVGRSHLIAWPERCLPSAVRTRYRAQIKRRAIGYPVAYLTGVREFWSLELRVAPETLIPRPETEGLVEVALTSLVGIHQPRLLDLGTGSGAVALAVASERPDATVVAVDICGRAIGVARSNARRLGLRNIRFLVGDWFEPLDGGRYHLILANPPYVDPTASETCCAPLRFEPPSALFASEEGLGEIRRIVYQATANLHQDGILALEHGYRQGPAVRALFRALGFEKTRTAADLQGHPRVTLGTRPAVSHEPG